MQGARKMQDFSKMHHDNKLWTGEHLNSEREIKVLLDAKKLKEKMSQELPLHLDRKECELYVSIFSPQ